MALGAPTEFGEVRLGFPQRVAVLFGLRELVQLHAVLEFPLQTAVALQPAARRVRSRITDWARPGSFQSSGSSASEFSSASRADDVSQSKMPPDQGEAVPDGIDEAVRFSAHDCGSRFRCAISRGPEPGQPPARPLSPFCRPSARGARPSWPGLNASRIASPSSGPTGRPVARLTRMKDMPEGILKGVAGLNWSASAMKLPKIGTATEDPVSRRPKVRGVSKPTKTPTARSGANPMNQYRSCCWSSRSSPQGACRCGAANVPCRAAPPLQAWIRSGRRSADP